MIYTARWVREPEAGDAAECIDVQVMGSREVASRRCQQLVAWHGLDREASGGLVLRYCEPGVPEWPPPQLENTPAAWVSDQSLETDPVELTLRKFGPGDSDFQREYKLLMGLVAARDNTVEQPTAGERWLHGARVDRYRLYADAAECRAAVNSLPVSERYVAEMDLSRLERALADQRERVALACPVEKGRDGSVVRCEISRRTLAVLDEHLEKMKQGGVPARKATCQSIDIRPDTPLSH